MGFSCFIPVVYFWQFFNIHIRITTQIQRNIDILLFEIDPRSTDYSRPTRHFVFQVAYYVMYGKFIHSFI